MRGPVSSELQRHVWKAIIVAEVATGLVQPEKEDILLGRARIALYRRAELKTLVDLHGNEAGKGGDLSHHEISIIKGALELAEKTAKDAMTPASEIFSIDINAKLDRDLLNLILVKGHSRVPVYHEHPSHIIGLILGITFELYEDISANDEEREGLQEIVNNAKLSEGYLTLAGDIEVTEPKFS